MEVRTALRPLAAGKRATGFPSAALRAGPGPAEGELAGEADAGGFLYVRQPNASLARS